MENQFIIEVPSLQIDGMAYYMMILYYDAGPKSMTQHNCIGNTGSGKVKPINVKMS